MTDKCKTCGSCGMPLEKAEDFSQGNTAASYCHYCTDDTGKLFDYPKILEMNVNYYMTSQGLTRAAAEKMAAEFLGTLPAWKKAG